MGKPLEKVGRKAVNLRIFYDCLAANFKGGLFMRKLTALLLAAAVMFSGIAVFAGDGEESVPESINGETLFGFSASRGRNDKKDETGSIPRGKAAFYLQLDGLQMDKNGSISGHPTTEFTGIVALADLTNPRRNKNYAIATGNGITEENILAEVKNPPSDDEAFNAARGQLMYKGYIRSDKGEVIPWSMLNSKYYSIDWYVFKCEDDGWHIDGRILDLETKDIINIVIPENPKDIPDEAYDDEPEDGKDNENGQDPKEEDEVTEDTSINLNGATFAYIFGYEPIVEKETDDEGNVKLAAYVRMGMDDSVTVEQVSAMLSRLLDREGYTKNMSLNVTPSVEPYRNEWFARGLAYQCAVGGLDSEGTIRLGDVSRGLVAKLVSRALKLSKTKAVSFNDVADSEYEEDIKKVCAYGYMNGVSDDSFAPDEIMTRAEFCQLFNNIIGRGEMGLTALDENGKEYEVIAEDYYFIDMSPKHWAYEVCLKATSAYDENGYVSFSKRQENIRNKVDDYDSQKLY